MPLDVHRQSAPTARGPAAGHGIVRGTDERHDLVTREMKASTTVVGHGIGVGLAVRTDGDDLLEDQHDAITVALVAHPDRAEHERGVVFGLGSAEWRDRRDHRLRQVDHQAPEVLGEGGDLLLLTLEPHGAERTRCLKVERPFPGEADRARAEDAHIRELEAVAHDGLNSRSSPVIEFTVSTIGPFGAYAIAVTEHGEITMRWNKSR